MVRQKESNGGCEIRAVVGGGGRHKHQCLPKVVWTNSMTLNHVNYCGVDGEVVHMKLRRLWPMSRSSCPRKFLNPTPVCRMASPMLRSLLAMPAMMSTRRMGPSESLGMPPCTCTLLTIRCCIILATMPPGLLTLGWPCVCDLTPFIELVLPRF